MTDTMRFKLGVMTVLLLGCAVPGAAALDTVSAPPAVTTPTCRSLPVTTSLRSRLRAAHHRVYARNFAGPPTKSTYHGRCGKTYYALASFNHPGVGYTDQPEAFRRYLGHSWRDQGDTGGDVCGSKKVPRSLLKVWKISCS